VKKPYLNRVFNPFRTCFKTGRLRPFFAKASWTCVLTPQGSAVERDVQRGKAFRTHKSRLRDSRWHESVTLPHSPPSTPQQSPRKEKRDAFTPPSPPLKPHRRAKRRKQGKARFPASPTASNKVTLAPRESPSEKNVKSLAATRLKKKIFPQSFRQ
jgi:hypothetical protein